jgi:hypothetical protein
MRQARGRGPRGVSVPALGVVRTSQLRYVLQLVSFYKNSKYFH